LVTGFDNVNGKPTPQTGFIDVDGTSSNTGMITGYVFANGREFNFAGLPYCQGKERPTCGSFCLCGLSAGAHTGERAPLYRQRDARPDDNKSKRRAQASRRYAVEAGADHCRCFVHRAAFPSISLLSRWSLLRLSQSFIFTREFFIRRPGAIHVGHDNPGLLRH
jgi:hypothetical protein